MARSFASASSQYLEIDAAVLTAAPFTIACWFVVVSLGSNSTLFSLADKDVTNHHFRLLFQASGDKLRLQTQSGGSAANADSSIDVTADVWHHGVGVAAAINDRTVYLDGGNSGTNTASRTPAGIDRTSIGRRGTSSEDQYWRGEITEVGLWDVAQPPDVIAALAAGYSPLFWPDGLVAYWQLVRDEDLDAVGSLNMTAFNTPTIENHPPIIYPAPPSFISIPAAVSRRIFITHT